MGGTTGCCCSPFAAEKRLMPDSRLTHYELELMDVLWRLGEGTVQDVCDNLERDLAYTTVMTTLSLLESKKGVLERVKQGRAYLYRPLVSREEMSRNVLSDLKDVLFRDKLPKLMLNFIDDEQPSPDDLQALKDAVRILESRRKGAK
jgi:predicted transcriptional regulator